MNRLKTLLIAAAVVTGSSALASALPNDHDGRGYGDRDRSRYEDRGRDNERRLDRDDYRFRDRDDHRFRDREDHRFRDRDGRRRFDRDEQRYFVGERRWISGYYWTWDGSRWCRRDGGINIYLGLGF